MTCPLCKGPATHVIYAGIPGGICDDDECACLWGLALYAARVWYTGWFITYDGTWRGLLYAWRRFLFGSLEADE